MMKTIIIPIFCLFDCACFGQKEISDIEKSYNEFCGGCITHIYSIMNLPKSTYVQGDLIYRLHKDDNIIMDYSLPNVNDIDGFKLVHDLYIQGLKQISHDTIIKWRFRYAHQIKMEIKKEEGQ